MDICEHRPVVDFSVADWLGSEYLSGPFDEVFKFDREFWKIQLVGQFPGRLVYLQQMFSQRTLPTFRREV